MTVLRCGRDGEVMAYDEARTWWRCSACGDAALRENLDRLHWLRARAVPVEPDDWPLTPGDTFRDVETGAVYRYLA